ncbi:MAG: hypothetical protein HOV80_38035 [Polyangiaceae bacterium]|nr:hypothetical protein [Polyangiaceae bacterium]
MMTRLSWLAVALFAVACDSNPEVPPPKTQATGATAAPGSAAPGGAGGVKESSITWKAPEAWTVVNHPSPMRLATYRIPKAEGDAEDGELTVTRVGGDVQSNIQRWSKQFEGSPAPKTSERTAGDMKVTIVELEGTFSGMAMPGQAAAGPKPDYAMLAAIVEGTGDPHFFKLTGPKKTVDAARGGFDELVASFGKR